MQRAGWLDSGRVEFRRCPGDFWCSDSRLADEIGARLARTPRIDSRHVRVTVVDRNVVLAGTVPQPWMKHAIENLTATTWAVGNVENHIEVLGTTNYWQR